MGFTVFQEKLILQLLPFNGIEQDEDAGTRVPDIGWFALHFVPFQKVPAAQEAFAFA